MLGWSSNHHNSRENILNISPLCAMFLYIQSINTEKANKQTQKTWHQPRNAMLDVFMDFFHHLQKSIAGKSRARFSHDDVIKWKHFSRNWPFVWGSLPVPVNSPNKGQCPGALMFSLIRVWINGWVNNREAGDLRRHRGHYDVSVMSMAKDFSLWLSKEKYVKNAY